MAQKPVNEMTEGAMKNFKTLLDSNTVIGKEIVMADGTTIIPVSKVSFGFASGGSDLPASQKDLFGGGMGSGVTITPIAFLVARDGDVKLLPVQQYNSSLDRAIDMAPGLVDKVSGFVKKRGGKDGEKDAPHADTAEDPAAESSTGDR